MLLTYSGIPPPGSRAPPQITTEHSHSNLHKTPTWGPGSCQVSMNVLRSCPQKSSSQLCGSDYQEAIKDLTLGPELALPFLVIGRLGDL